MTASKVAIEAFASEWAQLAGLAKDGEALFKRNFVVFLKRADRGMRTRRLRLLDLLANASLDSRPVQRIMESFEPEPPDFLGTAKQDLQRIWPRDVPVALKQPTVDIFLHLATKTAARAGVYAPLPFGRLDFGARNFPGQLVLAILENWPHMAVCGNPECPAPYFFAKRSTQRYCERGECTRYAVRKKALKWWKKEKAKNTTGLQIGKERKNERLQAR